MKSILCSAFALALLANPIWAQNIRYSELRDKMQFDNSPVKSINGLIASYAPVLENATPAVVTVFRKAAQRAQAQQRAVDPRERLLREMLGIPPGGGGGGGQSGLGSGVILTSDGYILTNNHVIDGAARLTVVLKDSRKEYEATVIGADPQTDVALIKIDAKNLTPIKIGDSDKTRVGDVVLAVGNPLGLEQTVTQGIISAKGRRNTKITGETGYENFIQTDASVNVGNSGGALIDVQGRLVGMNTAIKTDGTSRGNVGIAFAIPSNLAMNIVRKLVDGGGKARRGFLGISLNDLDEASAAELGRSNLKGALVVKVNPGTPAEAANMKDSDLIISMDGNPIVDSAQLRLRVSSKDPGEQAKFRIVRNGKEQDVTVELGDLDRLIGKIDNQPILPSNFRQFNDSNRKNNRRGPAPQRQQDQEVANGNFIPGVNISDLDRLTRSSLTLDQNIQGVMVQSVDENSPASRNGLEAGHIITQIDQESVRSAAEASVILNRFESDVLLLQVYKNKRRSILAIPIK